MSEEDFKWTDYQRRRHSDSSDDSSHHNIFLNPDISVLSDGTDLTVSFGERRVQNHSTPVNEEDFRQVQQGIEQLVINFLNSYIPIVRGPIHFTMSDHGEEGGNVVADDNPAGADGTERPRYDQLDPEKLADAIKNMGVAQLNTSEQMNTVVQSLNAMVQYHKDQSKIMDIYFTKMDDMVNSQREELKEIKKTTSTLKDIQERLDKRETDRVTRELEKDMSLKIKSDTFPTLIVPEKKSLSIEAFFSFERKVFSIVRSNNFNITDALPRSRVIDGILGCLSENAVAKTTTIRPNDRGLYKYASLKEFMNELRSCFCGEAVSQAAMIAFHARKQKPGEGITVYLSALYNLWDIGYDAGNKSYQLLMEHAINFLSQEGLRYHLKAIEIPARKARGLLQYNAEGFEELKTCMLETQASLKDARTGYQTTTIHSSSQQGHSSSHSEPMDTSFITHSGQKKGKNQSQKTQSGKPGSAQRSPNENKSGASTSQNPPSGSQARLRKAQKEAEQKIKAHRRDNNLCYTCGSPNHLSPSCDKKKQKEGKKSGGVAALEEESSAAAIGDEWFVSADELSTDHSSCLSVQAQMNFDTFCQWAEPWPNTAEPSDMVTMNVCDDDDYYYEEEEEENACLAPIGLGDQTTDSMLADNSTRVGRQLKSNLGKKTSDGMMSTTIRNDSVGNSLGPVLIHPKSGH